MKNDLLEDSTGPRKKNGADSPLKMCPKFQRQDSGRGKRLSQDATVYSARDFLQISDTGTNSGLSKK